jgi:hypothetical protein
MQNGGNTAGPGQLQSKQRHKASIDTVSAAALVVHVVLGGQWSHCVTRAHVRHRRRSRTDCSCTLCVGNAIFVHKAMHTVNLAHQRPWQLANCQVPLLLCVLTAPASSLCLWIPGGAAAAECQQQQQQYDQTDCCNSILPTAAQHG